MNYKNIAEKMKKYEKTNELVLNPLKPFIVRLDGHCFSKFTSQFNWPCQEFHDAMVETAKDLVLFFNSVPCAAHTCSDEISLVFNSLSQEDLKTKTLIYSGRVCKIASLASGYASTRFNHHISSHVKRPNGVCFDARVFQVENEEEILENLMWRSCYDCVRNSKSQLGRSYFSSKSLNKLNSNQIVEKLKNEKNVDWNELRPDFKFGSLVKKEQVFIDTDNGKVQRTRLSSKSIELTTVDKKLIVSKYWL